MDNILDMIAETLRSSGRFDNVDRYDDDNIIVIEDGVVINLQASEMMEGGE